MEPKYVFVVGLPRTGTKLVESIISKAPNVDYCSSGETFFAGHLLSAGVRHKLRRFGDLTKEVNVRRLVDYLYSGRLPGGYWRRLKSGYWGVDRDEMLRAILASDRSPRAIYAILLSIHTTVGDRTLLGDKTPAHLYHVPLLLDWFPLAKVVHTFRDPRAILASELRKRLERVPARYIPFKREHPLYAATVLMHVTASWRYAVRLHCWYERRYPANYTLCQFEALVSDPEPNVRRLCTALGLTFDPTMLTPRRSDSSYAREAASGFDVATLNRWRTALPAWMLAWMEFWTRTELPVFNYT